MLIARAVSGVSLYISLVEVV